MAVNTSTILLLISGLGLAMSPLLSGDIYAASSHDRTKDVKKQDSLTLICSTADFGGAFKGHTMKVGESFTVGCATERSADHHIDWQNIENGAYVVRCGEGVTAHPLHEAFGHKDTVITVKCVS